MSNALDQFEVSLVHASRALHQAGGSRLRAGAHSEDTLGEPTSDLRGPSRRSRIGRSLRRRPLRVAAGVLAVAALTAAGSSLFGPHGNPRTTFSIECGQGSFVESVSGDPVRDCATLWPSIYHRPAPSLVAWVASTGGAVVVVPAGTPPAGDRSFHWRRLPSGWTQDRATIRLNNQLNDIVTGLQAHTCWSAGAAAALVSSTLRADGLASWHLKVKAAANEGTHPSCLVIDSVVQGDSNSVLLIERHVDAPIHGSFRIPAAAQELARVASVEKRVNDHLSATGARCASISQAAALWRSLARTAGIASDRYVLFAQSPASATAGCARVLVNAPGGGGSYNVYVANRL